LSHPVAGGTLTPETVVEAYTRGCFPWRGDLLGPGAERWPRTHYLSRLAANATTPSHHLSWRDWRVACLPSVVRA
jgi:Leu/Phe-tRNA-protein transferase